MFRLTKWTLAALLAAVSALDLVNAKTHAQIFVENPEDVPSTWGPITLTNTGVQPAATGQAWLTDVIYIGLYVDGPYYYSPGNGWPEVWYTYSYKYQGALHVNCQGLDPKKYYSVGTSTPVLKPNRSGSLNFPAVSVTTWISWNFYELSGNWELRDSGFYVSVNTTRAKKTMLDTILEGTIPAPAIPDHPAP